MPKVNEVFTGVPNKITSMAQMIQWTKRVLGEPTIRVELVNEQIIQCAYDSADIINRYNSGDGHYQSVVAFNVVPGQDKYVFDDEIMEVAEIVHQDSALGGGFQNSSEYLWSNSNYVLTQTGTIQSLGGNGFTANGQGGNPQLLGYEIAMEMLKLVEFYFSKKFSFRWNGLANELTLIPTPTTHELVVLKCYRRNSLESMFQNPLFKKLHLAKCKRIWGNVLSKYNMSLAGGGSLNAESIKQEGLEEEKEALDEIKGESFNLGYFTFG